MLPCLFWQKSSTYTAIWTGTLRCTSRPCIAVKFVHQIRGTPLAWIDTMACLTVKHYTRRKDADIVWSMTLITIFCSLRSRFDASE
jgi:hypothetical protein